MILRITKSIPVTVNTSESICQFGSIVSFMLNSHGRLDFVLIKLTMTSSKQLNFTKNHWAVFENQQQQHFCVVEPTYLPTFHMVGELILRSLYRNDRFFARETKEAQSENCTKFKESYLHVEMEENFFMVIADQVNILFRMAKKVFFWVSYATFLESHFLPIISENFGRSSCFYVSL